MYCCFVFYFSTNFVFHPRNFLLQRVDARDFPSSKTLDQTYTPDPFLSIFPCEDKSEKKTTGQSQHSRVRQFCFSVLQLLIPKFPLLNGYILKAGVEYNINAESCSSNLKVPVGQYRKADLVIELQTSTICVPKNEQRGQKVPIVFGEVISRGKDLTQNFQQLFFYQFSKQRPYTLFPTKLLSFLVEQDGSRAYLHELQVNDWFSSNLFLSDKIVYQARIGQTTEGFLYDFFYHLLHKLTVGLQNMSSKSDFLSFFQTPSPTFHFSMDIKHQKIENYFEMSANVIRCRFSQFLQYYQGIICYQHIYNFSSKSTLC